MKAFLFTILFGAFALIGFVMLAGLGLIPQSWYSLWYSAEQSLGLGGTSVVPYLEKFEGYWDISMQPAMAESEIGKCTSMEGSVRVQNGEFSGSIGPFGSSVGIHASTTEKGDVAGGFSTAGIHHGTIMGKIYNGAGQGTWVDNYECKGTITFTKLDPVVDPVQGTIQSFTGDVSLTRGGTPRWIVAGEPLYVGDLVQVSTNSEALVVVGGQKTTVGAGSQFVVPEPVAQ
jgi:hypothetical protein